MKRVIIITGDSSGIGKDLATLFKDDIVYGISRRKIDVPYKRFECDVLDSERLKSIVDEIYKENGRIDIVVASAGLGISGAVEIMEKRDIDYQMDVNFNGVVNIDKAVLPYMREQGFGRIVHISSVAAVAPMPFQSFYSASKSALNSYSLALQNEVKPFGVKIVTVMPGDIKTGFTQSRIKIEDKDNLYNGRVEKASSKMENDELNGSNSIKVSKEIYKIINKKNLKVLYTIGFEYKLLVFLMKILPVNFVNKMLYKIYAK